MAAGVRPHDWSRNLKRLLILVALLMFGVLPLFVFVGRHWSLFQFGSEVEEVSGPIEIESQPIHAIRSEENGFGRRDLVRNLLAGPIEVDCRLESAENVKVGLTVIPRSACSKSGK